MLRQALLRLFEPEEFVEITGIDFGGYRLAQRLEDRFINASSDFASPEDPPTPGVWVLRLLVIAINRMARAALAFKDACLQLSDLCKQCMDLCTEGT